MRHDFYTVRPIQQWPGNLTRNREYSRFKAEWARTLELLERELDMLGARHVVLQMAVEEWDIRQDGGIRSNARPAQHPGVILVFDSRFGPLNYACDQYLHWQDNVRAIALSLEALRKVDRYGVSKRGEQYKGWKALPGPVSDDPTSAWSQHDAAAFIHRWSDKELSVEQIESSSKLRELAYREAAYRLHPDRGGDAKNWKWLQKAKEILERDHALTA